MNKAEGYHQPVLLKEAVDGLNIKPNGTYVDVTFGGGGHSREILKRLDKGGRLIAFDQDPDAKRNIIDDERFTLVDQNFGNMKNWLRLIKVTKVDGVLADLGVSSHQFDSEERGFSIRFDAPLDMRMDQHRKQTAADIVNNYSEEQLIQIMRQYGEVDNARGIVRSILSARPIETSGELKDALQRHLIRGKEHKVLAQVFQALRIEVNEELQVLKNMLQQSAELLNPEGRLVVISYHSLEDRLVKDFMRSGNFEGESQKDFFGNLIRPLKPLSGKPMLPTEEEINRNNRARSAKMRIAIKLGEESN
jgi:16S rRNA (cytosine1402-N4)-methyltransferase